jgi:hypothetical protein
MARTTLLAATASLLGLGTAFGHSPHSETFGRHRRGGFGSYTPPMTPKARPNRAALRRARRISARTSRCRPAHL